MTNTKKKSPLRAWVSLRNKQPPGARATFFQAIQNFVVMNLVGKAKQKRSQRRGEEGQPKNQQPPLRKNLKQVCFLFSPFSLSLNSFNRKEIIHQDSRVLGRALPLWALGFLQAGNQKDQEAHQINLG